jgi:hypothetical protein
VNVVLEDNAAEMSGGKGWWILVEAPTGGDSRWELTRAIPVDGGREQAVTQAAELVRKCDQAGQEVQDPEAYGRRVFRNGEADWLVEVGRSYWSDDLKKSITFKTPVRISVAELEHQSETPDAEPPAKGRLWRALGMS